MNQTPPGPDDWETHVTEQLRDHGEKAVRKEIVRSSSGFLLVSLLTMAALLALVYLAFHAPTAMFYRDGETFWTWAATLYVLGFILAIAVYGIVSVVRLVAVIVNSYRTYRAHRDHLDAYDGPTCGYCGGTHPTPEPTPRPSLAYELLRPRRLAYRVAIAPLVPLATYTPGRGLGLGQYRGVLVLRGAVRHG